MRKVVISNVVLAIAFALVGYWYYSLNVGIGAESAKAKAEKFITDNLVQPGTDVKITGITQESDVYKMNVVVGKQEIVAYMSKDGKNFFPEGMNMEEMAAKSKQDSKAAEPAKEAPKSDKPSVELFVMSYCPYGTQIEKGILPVVETLGKNIDFKLKFVDYAMHDKKEIDENLTQYCIQKEQPGQLASYLKCFLKDDSKAAECLASSGVNAAKLSSCVKNADEDFKITENYNNKNAWNGQFPPFNVDKADNDKYGVQGSPSLVINGTEISTARDSASLLKAVCASFNNQPQECSQELSSATPAAGFGDGTTTASNPDAGCGN